MNLAEFKQKYPAYADVPDEQLASALYRKYYEGRLPLPEFRAKLGLPANYDITGNLAPVSPAAARIGDEAVSALRGQPGGIPSQALFPTLSPAQAGVGETALQFLTGIPARAAGWVSAVAPDIQDPTTAIADVLSGGPLRRLNEVTRKLTYEPKTSIGRRMAGATSAPFIPFEVAGQEANRAVTKHGIGPLPLRKLEGAAASDAAQFLPFILGGRAAEGMRDHALEQPASEAAAAPAPQPQAQPKAPAPRNPLYPGEPAENPTAEPVADLLAQVKDLHAKGSPRRAVYLPDSDVQVLHAAGKLADVSKGTTPVINIDGKGGILLAKSRAIASQAKTRLLAGEPFQQVIGRLVGSGEGKPPNGTHVVQSLDKDGNVVRESLVAPDQLEATRKAFERPGHTVRVLTPQEALDRRAQGVPRGTAPEQPQGQPVPAETPTATGQSEADARQIARSQAAAQRARARLIPRPQHDDFVTWLRKHGGIDTEHDTDLTGRLKQLDAQNRTVGLPSIERKGKGLTADAATEKAIEAGYLPPGSSANDLIDKLETLAVTDRRHYSSENPAAIDQQGADALAMHEEALANQPQEFTPEEYDIAAQQPGNEAADSEHGRAMAALMQRGREVLGDAEVERISEENDSSDEKFLSALQEAINERDAGRGTQGTPKGESARPGPAVAQGKTDLFGRRVPETANAIERERRRLEEIRRSGAGVPADRGGGLFSDEQRQADLTDAMAETAPQQEAQPEAQHADVAPNGELKFSVRQKYHGEHAAPGHDSGSPLSDVTANGIYPGDVYTAEGRRYYGTGYDSMDAKAHSLINEYRNHPNRKVTVYRAVPHSKSPAEQIADLEKKKSYILKHGRVPASVDTVLSSSDYYDKISNDIDELRNHESIPQAQHSINPGDWVTPIREYAKDHGESALNGEYKIVSKSVKASDIYTNGDSWLEWGYDPHGAHDREPGLPLLDTRDRLVGTYPLSAEEAFRGTLGKSSGGRQILALEKLGLIKFDATPEEAAPRQAGLRARYTPALVRLASEARGEMEHLHAESWREALLDSQSAHGDPYTRDVASRIDALPREQRATVIRMAENPRELAAAEHAAHTSLVAHLGGLKGLYDPRSGVLHLVYGNIRPGEEMAVALHEITHATVEDLLGPEEYQRAIADIKAAAARGDPIAKRAIERIPEKTPPEHYDHEVIAYAVEEALKAMHAGKTRLGRVGAVLQRLVRALRARLAGTRLYKLAAEKGIRLAVTPQDAVAFAREGLRRLEASAREEAPERVFSNENSPFYSVRKEAEDSLVRAEKAPTRLSAAADGIARAFQTTGNEVTGALSPIAAAPKAARAFAKDFMNASRASADALRQVDKKLLAEFTPEERTAMYEALGRANVAERTGGPEAGQKIIDALPEKQRATIEALIDKSRRVADEAVALGMIKDRFDFYDPRIVTQLGEAAGMKLTERKGLGTPLDKRGAELRTSTPQMRRRKYLTPEETEAAAKKKLGEDAQLVRDIRVVPFAAHALERAVAGRKFVDALRDFGNDADAAVSSENAAGDPSYFTLPDHPAFWQVRPRGFRVDEEGKLTPQRDENGDIIFDRKPIYLHKSLEGAVRAVVDEKRPNIIWRANLAMKHKSLSTIIGLFPPIHRAVIFWKTVPLMPLRMLSFQIQRMGREIQLDPVRRRQAILEGVDPIAGRGWIGAVYDVGRAPELIQKPGHSWTAKLLGLPAQAISKEAELEVRKAVDWLGELWHDRLMWHRVEKTQFGLWWQLRNDLQKKGLDELSSGRLAAHLANRYVGAIPKENTAQWLRNSLNVVLFSRTFTGTNIGIYKDVITGLDRAVAAQIERDSGPEMLAKARKIGRRKQLEALVKDIIFYHLSNAALQTAIAEISGRQDTNQVAKGYLERWNRMLAQAKAHPWDALNPLADYKYALSLLPQSENEPGKQNRIFVGYDSQHSGIYLKAPTGRIGEDLLDFVSSPISFFKRKMSPALRAANAVVNNDRGFDRKIYDPDAEGLTGAVTNIARVAEYAFAQQVPGQNIENLKNVATGEDRTKPTILQLVGMPLGLFFSHGYPGGRLQGELAKVKREEQYRYGEVAGRVYRILRNATATTAGLSAEKRLERVRGAEQKAIKIMQDANIPVPRIRSVIRYGLTPERVNVRHMRELMQAASPLEQQKIQREIEQRDSQNE